MTDSEMVDLLRRIRFVEDAGEDDLRRLASVAAEERFAPGDVLFRVGDEAEKVYLIAEGAVALDLPLGGERRTVQTVGPGELLGWSPLLKRKSVSATARALTPVRSVALDARQVLALCSHDPAFGLALMTRIAETLAERLKAVRLQLLDVYRSPGG